MQRLAIEEPALKPIIHELRVLSRKYTGVGCYTQLNPLHKKMSGLENRVIGWQGSIELPEVSNGLMAILFCEKSRPDFIEFATYGNDHWDGTFSEFVFN